MRIAPHAGRVNCFEVQLLELAPREEEESSHGDDSKKEADVEEKKTSSTLLFSKLAVDAQRAAQGLAPI
jgi:hypothetical protein